MKFFETPNFSILCKLNENATLFALSYPKISLSFT